MRLRPILRRAAIAVAVISKLAALSVAMLLLVLLLLLLLFDRVTQGVMVLLGALLEWLRSLLPAGSGGGLPPYRALAADPLGMALRSLLLGLPCAVGLLLIAAPRWRLALPCWGFATVVAIVSGEPTVAAALLPGLLALALFELSRVWGRWPQRVQGRRPWPSYGNLTTPAGGSARSVTRYSR